jgi:type II secretory pathway component GspD/PulD (secretin)
VNVSNAGAWLRAPLRHAALSVAIWACIVCAPAQTQLETLVTANYRDADIRTVAEQVQQIIGRPIVLDRRVQGRVTILSNAPMTPDAFYRTFVAALEVHGFVPRQSGDAILIVPLQENRE